MLAGIRSCLTYANVMASIAVFIALGAGAYAAGLAPNSVKSEHIVDGKVKSVDVKDNDLTGDQVRESTLQGVDAGSVSGIALRKISFDVPYGTGPTEVLDFKGLKITAECQSFGDWLDVKATTTKDDAGAYLVGVQTTSPSDTDGTRDITGDQLLGGAFGVGSVINVDNVVPRVFGDSFPRGIATLHYEAPDRSVVVVELTLDGGTAPDGCTLTGFAIGG